MEEGEEETEVSQLVGKVGAKKLRRLQEKADKKAMREVSISLQLDLLCSRRPSSARRSNA